MSQDIEHEPWRANEYGNLALVRAVKERPCLYNNTIPEYSNKEITSRAWQEIADEFGCTVYRCKKWWMKLRAALAKDLRKRKSGKKKVHYLASPMDFVIPFMLKNWQEDINRTFQDSMVEVLEETITRDMEAENADQNSSDCDVDNKKTQLSHQNETIHEENSMLSLKEEFKKGKVLGAVDAQLLKNRFANLKMKSVLKANNVGVKSANKIGVSELNKELRKAIADMKGSVSFTTKLMNPKLMDRSLVSSTVDDPFVNQSFDSSDIDNSLRQSSTNQSINSSTMSQPSCSSSETKNSLINDKSASGGDSLASDATMVKEQYVMSLLPELDELTEFQFRLFKRKMFALIDDVKRKK